MHERAGLSRRGVTRGLGLAGALGGVGALSGCATWDSLDPREPTPAPSPAGSAEPEPVEPEADVALLIGVVTEVAALEQQVRRALRRFKPLRDDLKPLAKMHAAHLRVLDSEGTLRDEAAEEIASADKSISKQPASERARLVKQEQRLLTALTEAADRADSGQLARLLASISASVAQRLSVLGSSPGGL